LKIEKLFYRISIPIVMTLIHTMVYAQTSVDSRPWGVETGVGSSAIWLFANICYAGMRAQDNPSVWWRIISFIFGFPGTFLTFIFVEEGGERAYGIDLPKRK
jgi:hypothetical protein